MSKLLKKLDRMAGYWDAGVNRGLPTSKGILIKLDDMEDGIPPSSRETFRLMRRSLSAPLEAADSQEELIRLGYLVETANLLDNVDRGMSVVAQHVGLFKELLPDAVGEIYHSLFELSERVHLDRGNFDAQSLDRLLDRFSDSKEKLVLVGGNYTGNPFRSSIDLIA